jgi:transcriptional regulator with XRE-family HTH domain
VDRCLTQREIAALLQTSRSAYSNYERGMFDIPLEVICGIADLHHTSLDYLAGLTDQRVPRKKEEWGRHVLTPFNIYTIFSGRTVSSNSSAVISPMASTASFSVVPSRRAFLAHAAACS